MSRNTGKYQKNKGWLGIGFWKMIGLAVVCVAFVGMMVVFLMKLNGGNDEQAVNPTDGIMQYEPTHSTQAETFAPEEETTEAAENNETFETIEPETEETKTKDNSSNKNNSTGNNNNSTGNNNNSTGNNSNSTENNNNSTGNNDNSTTPQKPSGNTNTQTNTPTAKPTEPEEVVIELPYDIPGYGLQIQRIASYDGIYLEDGSDTDASGVAMMLLTNTGSEAVEYANITLYYGDEVLTFKASALPAGGKVVVQATDREGMASGDITECVAEVAPRAALEMSESQVSVVDNGNNSLTIKNLTNTDIVTVRVFYKYYMADENAYVGGITYTAKIQNLKAGDSITVTPSHYSSEASTVVMVRTYDTDA